MKEFQERGQGLRAQAKALVLEYMQSTSDCQPGKVGVRLSPIFRACGFDWGEYPNGSVYVTNAENRVPDEVIQAGVMAAMEWLDLERPEVGLEQVVCAVYAAMLGTASQHQSGPPERSQELTQSAQQ